MHWRFNLLRPYSHYLRFQLHPRVTQMPWVYLRRTHRHWRPCLRTRLQSLTNHDLAVFVNPLTNAPRSSQLYTCQLDKGLLEDLQVLPRAWTVLASLTSPFPPTATDIKSTHAIPDIYDVYTLDLYRRQGLFVVLSSLAFPQQAVIWKTSHRY